MVNAPSDVQPCRSWRRGLALPALILRYLASWQWAKDRAVPLVAKLKTELPPDVVAAAQERGKALDLEQVVVGILSECS
jgi:hypothetical protein